MKTNNLFIRAKKLLALGLALGLLLALAACGGTPAPSQSAPAPGSAPASAAGSTSTPAAGNAITIGIIQLVENGAFADMREGFIAQMRALGYGEDQVVFDYQNAQGDVTALNTICQNMADSDAAAIVTIATPPTQAMVNLDSGKPVFYISVSDPLLAGVITDMEHPDKNATGASNAIPVSEMFKLADELTPGCETYGFIYNTGEVNAVKTVEAGKAYLDEAGLAHKEAVVTNSSEVQQAAQSLVGSIDAFFLPNDSMVQSALPQVAEVAIDAGIPIYGSSAVMVASGAFATISIDDVAIGGMVADMLKQHLDGTPVSDIPAITVEEFTTVINKTTAAAIGIELPQDVLDSAVILE